jgi:AraC-like DNA-binding protein
MSSSKDITQQTLPITIATFISREPQEKHEIQVEKNALILVKKGAKTVYFENEQTVLNQDALLFLGKGSYMMSEVLDNGYYEAMVFLYEDELLLDFIHKYGVCFDRTQLNKTDIFKIQNSAELKNLIQTSYDYFHSQLQNKEELLKLKQEEAFLNILNSSSKEVFLGFLQSIYEANHFKSQLLKSFSYEENILNLAHTFKISEVAFREKFKQTFGLTPKKWQTMKRLEKAKILLENTDKNVSQVCQEVGFDNISWFIQVFKKQYHFTPKQLKTNKN